MQQLIIKDFAVQKKMLLLFSLFVLLFTFMYVLDEKDGNFNAFFLYMVCIPIYSFVTRVTLEEEKNNTMRFLDSLPISRDSLVCARYISVLAYTLLNLALFLFIDCLCRILFFGTAEHVLRDLVMEAFFILIFLVVNSIYLPFVYKLGYKKAGIINTLALVCVFGAIGAISKGFKSASPDFANKLGNLISPVNITTVMILILAVYLVSMEISIAVLKRRDLYS